MNIEEYKIKFGKRLRELREERKNNGFTQEYLSGKLDCDTKKISTMENGTSAPKFEDLFILAELFNVNFDYLMGLSNTRRVFKANTRSTIDKKGNIVPEKIETYEERYNRIFGFPNTHNS